MEDIVRSPALGAVGIGQRRQLQLDAVVLSRRRHTQQRHAPGIFRGGCDRIKPPLPIAHAAAMAQPGVAVRALMVAVRFSAKRIEPVIPAWPEGQNCAVAVIDNAFCGQIVFPRSLVEGIAVLRRLRQWRFAAGLAARRQKQQREQEKNPCCFAVLFHHNHFRFGDQRGIKASLVCTFRNGLSSCQLGMIICSKSST